MTTFYCVRHGKTEFNLNKIFQGGLADSPLLPEGIENAKKVGMYLSDINFNHAFSSPQKRAQDTASNLLDNHSSSLELETIENLREMEFGLWDGLPEKDYHHLKEFQNLVNAPHLYDPTDFQGESFDSLIKRMLAVFNQLSERYPDDTILIVSHGLALQTILKYLDGSPLCDIRKGRFLDNTSVTVIESTPNTSKFNILNWNDTSFLD
ncbi:MULTISPECIES: histidine phosphatase family protein [Vagococcus]|uniref:Phosphoglycerate mutase family 5 n=1 Tax=Vagococcus fluvialis bH819 TaxID=1255619 RepID=A0A1X6WR29_9ENTE|nr:MULTISPECIES: histidine phosphatase family protein [Vagococcus]SLM86708.1 Phosphoglycerate mutase family 5 [Vagococcus fluvialis bH819]HCM90916.1 histidine phosphatase family protein [Vagococcus sp.]